MNLDANFFLSAGTDLAFVFGSNFPPITPFDQEGLLNVSRGQHVPLCLVDTKEIPPSWQQLDASTLEKLADRMHSGYEAWSIARDAYEKTNQGPVKKTSGDLAATAKQLFSCYETFFADEERYARIVSLTGDSAQAFKGVYANFLNLNGELDARIRAAKETRDLREKVDLPDPGLIEADASVLHLERIRQEIQAGQASDAELRGFVLCLRMQEIKDMEDLYDIALDDCIEARAGVDPEQLRDLDTPIAQKCRAILAPKIGFPHEGLPLSGRGNTIRSRSADLESATQSIA